jgi:hypothetical protein
MAQFGFEHRRRQHCDSIWLCWSSWFVFEGEKRFDLVVRLIQENRQTVARNLYVTASNGNKFH